MPQVPRILIASGLVLATVVAGGAATDKNPKPKGRISVAEILEKNASAAGAATLNVLESFHARGALSLPPVHGHDIADFNFYYKAPSKDLFVLEAFSHGQSRIGHTEKGVFLTLAPEGIQGLKWRRNQYL